MARNSKERKTPRSRRHKRTSKSTTRFYLIFGVILLLSLVVVSTATITLSTGLPSISPRAKTESIESGPLISTPPSIISQATSESSGYFDTVQIEGILSALRRVDQLLVRIPWKGFQYYL